MKRTLKQNMQDIKFLTNKMPKTINETMDFNENIPMHDYNEEEMPAPQVSGPQTNVPQKPANEEEMDATTLIKDISKKTLRALAALVDTPDDPNYDTLMKIWSIISKSLNDSKETKTQVPND